MRRSFHVGLGLLGVLSALDLVLPVLSDGEHPPMAVALAGSAVGLASLALIVSAWRGGARATAALMILRLVSAVSAVPAFFAGPEVPAVALGGAALVVALNVFGILLVLPTARRAKLAGAQ